MDVRKGLIVARTAAFSATVALAATGCAKPTSPAGPVGGVHGTIVLTGGPSQASPAGAAGTVVVSRDGDEVARQTVADGQEFRFALSVGGYELSVTGVDGACAETGVTVSASVDTAVSLTCQRK